MSNLIKPTMLGLVLATGFGVAAQAQTENLAKLPPVATVAPAPAPIGPSAPLVGPNPGGQATSYMGSTQAVSPSVPPAVGPSPGGQATSYMGSTQSAIAPSGVLPGPRAN